MPKMGWLVDLVARAPARVQVKLLAAFLAIAMLLIMLGTVGLQVLSGVSERTEDFIGLQRKIEAYRQVQRDTISQLYSVSSALLSSDDPTLSRTLRQLNQFGYDVDRLQFVAKDEVELLGRFRQDYDQFVEIVTHGVEMIRAGRAAEAREMQAIQAAPLADRLERLTNQLVNKAEADMVAGIETSRQVYENSQRIIIAFALGSILLALALGYTISWSLIGPVKRIEAQLKQVAAGDFTHSVDIINRDELGTLGAGVNKMSEKLGQLYQQLHRHTDDLSESLQQQTATADVLKVISRSTFDLQKVLDTLVASAAELCRAERVTIFLPHGDAYKRVASHGASAAAIDYLDRHPFAVDRGSFVGRVALERRTIQIDDVEADPEFKFSEESRLAMVRTILGVPLMRQGSPIGVLALTRPEIDPFTEKHVELVESFADQAVIAIENTRLLNELRERTEEVEKLNQHLEQRVADQVGEIERMGRLRRFLPPQVADLIVASGSEKQLESHRREITALFCDLRGFTGFTESADAEDVMALLRDYHAAIGEIIIKYNGTLERYAGDGVMVVFNDPVPVENPALQAVLMALEVRDAIGALTEKWRRWGHDLGFGIGIAHGFATLGTIGFEGRFDYAAIGTVSNVASRLCDEAKPGQILISPRVLTKVENAVTVEPVGEFELKGIRRPLAAYNVVAIIN